MILKLVNLKKVCNSLLLVELVIVNFLIIYTPFFNPGPYAGYLSMILPIALAIYLHNSNTKQNAPATSAKAPPKSETLPNNLKQPETTLKPLWNNSETTLKQYETKIQLIIQKYLSLAAMIVIFLVIPATRSRASWLATIAGSIFLLYHYYPLRPISERYLNTRWKKLLAIVTMVVFMGGLSAGIYYMKKGSADGRLLIWKVSSRLIKEKPVFGYGHEKFQAYYMAEQAEYFRENPESRDSFVADDIIYPFNEFIKGLTELGVAGISLMLLIILSVFSKWKSKPGNKPEHLKAISLAGIFSFIIFSFFSYPTEIMPILINLVILLSISASFIPKPVILVRRRFNIFEKRSKLIRVIFGVSAILLILAFYSPVRKLFKAYYYWDEGYKIYQMGAYHDCLESFEQAYPVLKYNGEFLIMYGKALTMAEDYITAIEILNRAGNYQQNTILFNALGDSYKHLKQFENAEKAYLKAYYMIPSRFYSKYLLAKLYLECGEGTKALSTAKELINKEVKVPSKAIEEIRTEMREIIESFR